MRLSEKTLEINICSQISEMVSGRIIWFGLTQRQEARAGFDACTRLGGRLLILQFKASNKYVRSGTKQFYLHHRQLQNLIDRVDSYRRSIFYVFPMVGNTRELSASRGDLIRNTWLLDVSDLPNPFPPALTRKNTVRKNNIHYADIRPPTIHIHSKTVEAKGLNCMEFIRGGARGADGLMHLFQNDFDLFDKFRIIFNKNAKAAILL